MISETEKISVIAISSQVVYGSVGLSIAVPCLESLGLEVLPIPTIILANRPGLGTYAALEIRKNVLNDFLTAFHNDGWFDRVSGILTGYFVNPDQVLKVAEVIARIKNDRKDVIYVCDPVLGDYPEGLYVTEDTAEAVKDRLLPLADLVTPNLFETRWLTSNNVDLSADSKTLRDLPKNLNTRSLIITSTSTNQEAIKSVFVTNESVIVDENKYFDDVPKGTGDAFSALILANILKTSSVEDAFDISLRQIATLSEAASGAKTLAAGLSEIHLSRLFHKSD